MLPTLTQRTVRVSNKTLLLTSVKSFTTRSETPLTQPSENLKSEYDVVVIGGGHNGLIAAAYLQKAGKSVCVLERRHVLGGAAVTEEIVPGFKFSRASYVLSLLRPFIISDLKLKAFGLKVHMREPYSSFTPIHDSSWKDFPAKYLLLSGDVQLTCQEIAKFSPKDAENYPKYEEQLSKYVQALNILVDNPPPSLWSSNFRYLSKQTLTSGKLMLQIARALGKEIPTFHEMLTASAEKILNKWFESEPLKATLATDALIGAMLGPSSAGSGYVLLHHIMGGVDGKPGAWAYPEGGMGAVSTAIAKSASSLGASIFTNKQVQSIQYTSGESPAKATGVILESGEQVRAREAVFSSATPEVTFKTFFPLPQQSREALFGEHFVKAIDAIDYTSPVTKINVALSRLPNFLAKPNTSPNTVQHLHKCTIHLNSETMQKLNESYSDCLSRNIPSISPMIEATIPSSVDQTLAPPGAHVCLLFTQFTPITPSDGHWSDENYKNQYASRVFDIIDEYAPGFKASIIGADVLSPWDLEATFGLTGGNIFHGAMSMDQLYWLRPAFTRSSNFPHTPLKGLYLSGSGAHPGGGVMGLPGYLAAKAFLSS